MLWHRFCTYCSRFFMLILSRKFCFLHRKTRLIIASVTKNTRMQIFHTILLPMPAIIGAYLLMSNLNSSSMNNRCKLLFSGRNLALLYSIYAFLEHFRYCHMVINEICCFLGIDCFRIGRPKSDSKDK